MTRFYLSLFCAVGGAVIAAAYWSIFRKSGIRGWKSIVPVYGMVMLADILERPRYEVLLLFIPGVNVVYHIFWMKALSRQFGHASGTAALLFFVPYIGIPILAYGASTYQGKLGGRPMVPVDPLNTGVTFAIITVSLLAYFLLVEPRFSIGYSPRLFLTVFRIMSVNIPLTVAMALMLRSGKLDIGSLAGFTLVAWLPGMLTSAYGMQFWMALALCVVLALVVWSGIGYAIEKFNLPGLPVGLVVFVAYVAVMRSQVITVRTTAWESSPIVSFLYNGGYALAIILAVAFVLDRLLARKTLRIPLAYAIGSILFSLTSILFGTRMSAVPVFGSSSSLLQTFLSLSLAGALVPGGKPSLLNAALASCVTSAIMFSMSLSGLVLENIRAVYLVLCAVFIAFNLLLSGKKGKDLAKSLLF